MEVRTVQGKMQSGFSEMAVQEPRSTSGAVTRY
jgi:hypothetical protein